MLEKFKPLIYSSEIQRKQVEEKCLQQVIENNPNHTRENIFKLICSKTPNEIAEEYYIYSLLPKEGQMLFDLTVDKFGKNLWNRKAWENKTCHKRCPFGDICKKQLIQVDEKFKCYGQLYFRKINAEKVKQLALNHTVKIFNNDKSVYMDLNQYYDEQMLSSFFFQYEWFIWNFGDYGEKKGKVNGENVIQFLQNSKY